eukprot:125265_1
MSTGNPNYPNLNEGGALPPAYNEAAPSAPAAYNPQAVTAQAPQYNATAPTQQVIYQQPAQQGQIQGNQQVVYQQPTQQQQVVYVNQYGQPVQPPTQQGQQPQVVYVQQQPQQTQQPIIINNNTTQQSTQQATQQQVVVAQPYRRERPDDPSCLYILACFGFFFWPIGAIGMCCYNCGSNLPPRQAQAFKVLVALTLLGVVINIIYYVAAPN